MIGIIYSTKFGTTEKVALRMAEALNAEAVNIKNVTEDRIRTFDTIILGTGVYAGRPSKKVVDFANFHNDIMPSVKLFVCCLYGDDKGAKQLSEISKLLNTTNAVFFSKAKDQIGKKDSDLEKYIESLR